MNRQGVALYPAAREVVTLASIRLSDDNDGTMSSPDTQWTAICRTAVKFNVPIPRPEHVFTDRDLSASDPNIVRFDYERMLKLIESFDPRQYEIVVLAMNADRVFRQPRDWQRCTELLGPGNLDGRLLTDWEGNFDLGPMGIFSLGAAYVESKKTAHRSKAGIATAAENGKGHGRVSYGWKREYDHSGTGRAKSTTVIYEAQASVIREAAARVLKGDSLRAICADFNARGVPAPGAGRVLARDPVTRQPITYADDVWLPQKLRQILVRLANKGIREHTSGRGARKTTTLYKAEWPAILDDDTFDTLVAKLNDPERRTTTSNTAKHLLSGIGICGKVLEGGKPCGRAVIGRISHKGRKGKEARTKYYTYSCEKGHVVKSLAQTERIVTTEVLHILSQPEIRASLTPTPDTDTRDALAREAGLLARKEAAADQFSMGEIDAATLARVSSNIGRQIDELRRTINRRQDIAIYTELLNTKPADLEALWDSYEVTYRRSIVKALFDVTFLPNPQVGKGFRSAFDPTTIRIDLRPMKG